MTIEQAIFSSACTERGSGYQLLARSSGLNDAAARELTAVSPSHDSLLPGRRTSTNFVALAGGLFGISLTTLAGQEYSGRGGQRVHTHTLIAAPEALAPFANNPFLLLRAALAVGALDDQSIDERTLQPLVLRGRAKPWSGEAQFQATAILGEARFAQLLDAATKAKCLAIAGDVDGERIMAGLMNAVPPERRLDYSFSTGLKHSPCREFRWLAADRDASEQRRLSRLGVTIFACDVNALAADAAAAALA